MAVLLEKDVQKALEDALGTIVKAQLKLESWKSARPVLTTQNRLWQLNSPVLKGVSKCLDIEQVMLEEAQLNPRAEATPEERKKVIEVQYLLFSLIDEAAREVKTTITSNDYITQDLAGSSRRIHRRARRSLYLHWRVVNLASASKCLKAWYPDEIAELRKTLLRMHGADVFLAHVSADKPLVDRVINGIRKRGEDARRDIIAAIDAFDGETDGLAQIFSQQRERLDAVSLSLWYDRFILRSGDNLAAKIESAISSAKVFLVFITQNYDLGTYMREIELPQIAEQLNQIEREEEVIAIPVVLSPKAWAEKKPQWPVPWRPVTCPPEPALFGVEEDAEKIADWVAQILTEDKELRNLTGDD
jgi:hypothetical protein